MTTPLPCPFCGEEPHFEGDANYRSDDGHYVEMSLTCCATINEEIGWKRGREMTVDARAAELKAKLIEAWNKRAAQPDCRTCRQFHWSQFTEDYRCHFIREGGSCVNGDKHFAVPAVVLWRTEP